MAALQEKPKQNFRALSPVETGAFTAFPKQVAPVDPSTFVPFKGVLDTIGEAANVATASAQGRDPALLQLQNQGVDTTTGLGAGVRASISAREFNPELRKKFLNATFSEGFRDTGAGLVVKKNGKEILVDETGFTTRDFADLVDEGIVTAASLGGAIAAAPALAVGGAVSLVSAAALAAASGQGAGAVKDLIVTAKDQGIGVEDLAQIGKDRGVAFLIDGLLDFSTGGGGKLLLGAVNKFRAPFRETAQQAVPTATRDAAEVLGVTTLRPSEITGSPALAGGEALVSKIPGSARVLPKLDDATEAQVRKVVNGLTGDAPDSDLVGKHLVDVLQKGADAAAASVEILKTQARTRALAKNEAAALDISSNNFPVDVAGGNARAGVVKRRDLARNASDKLYADVFDLPEASLPVFKVKGLRASISKLRKEFPQETVTLQKEVLPARGARRAITRDTQSTQAARAFLPAEAQKFLSSIANLDDMTLEQAIKGRAALNKAIGGDSALSDVGSGVLKKIAGDLTTIIDNGTKAMPNGQLKAALTRANANFKAEVLPFGEKGIAKLFKKEGQTGFVEDSVFAKQLFIESRGGELARIKSLLGAESTEWRDLRKSVFSDILQESGNLLDGNVIDPKAVLAKLSRMNTNSRKELLGDQQRDIVNALREAVSAGDLDITRIQDLTGGTADVIRKAATEARKVKNEYTNRIIKPFLRGELDSSVLAPDEFVKNFVSNASTSDIDQVFKQIGDNSELAGQLRKRVMMEIFERSRIGETSTDILKSQFGEGNPIGPNMIKAIQTAMGDGTPKKLLRILGKENFDTITALANLSAGRAISSQAQDAAGALVGGVIRAGLLQGNIKATLPAIIKYRIAAAIIQSKPLRNFVSKLPPKIKAGRLALGTILASPQIAQVINAEFKDDPEISGEIAAAFRTVGKQVNTRVNEINRVTEARNQQTAPVVDVTKDRKK